MLQPCLGTALGTDPGGDIAMIAAPVLPKARQAAGLQPHVAVSGGRDQTGQTLVMVQKPSKASARQIIHLLRPAFGSGRERIAPGLIRK